MLLHYKCYEGRQRRCQQILEFDCYLDCCNKNIIAIKIAIAKTKNKKGSSIYWPDIENMNKIKLQLKNKPLSNPQVKAPTLKMPKQRTQLLGNKQYVEAMKHMRKVNNYQKERKVHVSPLHSECTFAPVSYTASYRALIKTKTADQKKAQERLINWGQKKYKKQIQKILTNSLQIQVNVVTDLKKKQANKKYGGTSSFTKTLEFSGSANPVQSSRLKTMSKKQTSQTTLFSTGRVSLSPIPKRD